MARSLRQDYVSQAAGLPAEALAKAGGGEGSRTPVRNAIYIGIYTFSGSSGVSETLGRPAALRFLVACLVLISCPVTRHLIQPAKCHRVPPQASGIWCGRQLSGQCELVGVCNYLF